MYLISCWIEHPVRQIDQPFTYTSDEPAECGMRVRVNFAHREVTGFVESCEETDETLEQVQMVQLAAKTVGTPLTISADSDNPIIAQLNGDIRKESLTAFCNSMKKFERVRTISSNVPDEVFVSAAHCDKYIAQSAPVRDGRIELALYIKEQSIANEYHRYGSQIEVPEIE